MSGEEKNKLDERFKIGLDKPDAHFEFHDQDWDDMEQLLDANARPRRGIVYWLPVLSGVAAVLLLFLGWWLFKPAPVAQQQVAVKHLPVQQPADHTDGAAGINKSNDNDVNNIGATKNNNANQPDDVINTPAVPAYAGNAAASAHKYYRGVNPKQVQSGTKQADAMVNKPFTSATDLQKNEALSAVDVEKITPSSDTNLVNELPMSSMVDNLAAFTAKLNIRSLINAETIRGNRPVLSSYGKGAKLGLAMLVSPDINGAGSFQNAKVGTNIGLLFSVGITRKLTISTGAAYSKKPYSTDFSNYHVAGNYKFKTDPEEVYADCRVLDIPINVDYKLYSKSRNSFSIGSGLSSYIMLKEKYTYDYAVAGTPGPTSFTVTNKNRHILGVLNLNATYEHRLNSKFSLAAQPYFKMPLTDIGNSQVKLQSAGVAVGVHWNINQ